MKLSIFSLFALVVVAALVAAIAAADSPAPTDKQQLRQYEAPTPVKVFVCADSGSLSGADELGFLHAIMADRETLTIPHCSTAYLGRMTHADGHTFLALAVTTGIGDVSAAVCTQQMLALQQQRNLEFESVILMGTSGFSPFVGGWDPTNTAAAEAAAAATAFSPAAAAPPLKFQTRVQRQTDAAADLLRAAGLPSHGSNGATAQATTVNGIASNVNWERVVSQRQQSPDGCAPMRTSSAATAPPTPATADPMQAGLKYNRRLAVGSICVTSAAFLQESGTCAETLTASQCSRPNCRGFLGVIGASNIHAVRGAGSERLVRAIMAASVGRPFPAVPAVVREGMRTFWRSNEAAVLTAADGDGEGTEELTPSFVDCAESTMNAIAVGAQRDFLCRQYTAAVLNVQHQQQQQRQHGSGGNDNAGEEELARRAVAAASGPHTADSVVCVQAMEALGFLESMAAYPDIPVAVIRTASNYDMFPQQKRYLARESVRPWPAKLRGEAQDDESDPTLPYVWRQNVDYVSAEEYDTFVMASFHYSVQTVTAVVSNYFLGGRDLSSVTTAAAH